MIAAFALLCASPLPGDPPPVDFARDVQPILAAKCFTCHGPDEATREGDLRLDLRAELYKEVLPKIQVVTPGDLKASELWYRVTTDDEYEAMPPSWSDLPALNDAERETLRSWIEAGATWSGHWAYTAPTRPETPPGVHAVDHLAEALRGGPAAPAAAPAKLLRRLSLDLTGLPPEVADVEAFERDYAADPEGAYAAAVDALLASPHYGEARARRWLDLARYADTHGYEKDDRRVMWRWRDWVIDAFNADMPFDEFTVKQLAGDLLPSPALADRIATGFHRNTLVNAEGGVDPEEFRVAAVVDRVGTTGSVWLGTTMACAQCHSHKYDPFTQAEFYGLFAFFNQSEDTGNSAAPEIPAPTAADLARESELTAAIGELEHELVAPDGSWDAQQADWERSTLAELGPAPILRSLRPNDDRMRARSGATLTRTWGGILVHGERAPTDEYEIETELEGGGRVTALRLEVLGDDHAPVGRADDGNFVLTDIRLEVLRGGRGDAEVHRFAGASASWEQDDRLFPVLHAIDADRDGTGWAIQPYTRARSQAWFVLREPLVLAPDDTLRVRMNHGYRTASWALRGFALAVTDDDGVRARDLQPEMGPWLAAGPFTADGGEAQWSRLHAIEEEHVGGRAYTERYADGDVERGWEERPDWIDARVHGLEGEQAAFFLRRTVESETTREVELWLGSDDSIRAYLNGQPILTNKAARGAARKQERVRVNLNAGRNELLLKVVNYGGPGGFAFEVEPFQPRAVPDAVERSLRRAPADRGVEDRNRVRRHFRREVSAEGRALGRDLDALGAELLELREAMPTAMILRERGEPRATHLLEKGSFLSPGALVEPHTPASLHPWPAGAPKNRLGLARWLVDPANPLTARVTVNRLWEELFGTGLVETSDDFGTRGDQPTSQALLDWLAVEFVEGGWSVKGLLRSVVTSDTYRQRAAVDAATLAQDPRNTRLTRGARHRLPAEAVRDNALAIAGLLDRTLGGPSVMPPQPDGIWAATYSGDAWMTDEGPARYRRGLYTFLRRTAPYPTYLMFDATSREVSCTRRARTNTPLQALAALNDPAFVEAAGGLAVRMLAHQPANDAARLEFGFRACTARRPEEAEVDVLMRLLEAERAHYAADTEAAVALEAAALPLEPSLIDRRVAPERAAWIVVANALLNLDETLTKD